MKYEDIKADSYNDAIIQIKKKYGDKVHIIKSFEFKEGGFLGIGQKKVTKVLIGIPDDDYLKKEKENFLNISKERNIKDNAGASISVKESKERLLKNPLVNNNESISLSLVMEKLNKLEKVFSNIENPKSDNLHPNLNEIKEILKENEFYDDFIDILIKEIQDILPFSKIDDKLELHQYVLDFIKKKMVNTLPYKFGDGKKKVVVLVGPTGVGKTTTVAKLAANAVREKVTVKLITIDGFRLGAKYQLEKYAEIMGIDISIVEDNLELQKVIGLSDAELVIVDTIGRSQKDEINLAKMKQLLELKNISADYILTISATTKPKEVKKIFKTFELFDYSNVIITKYDESEIIGSIINCCIDRNKGILYVTDGQKVPNDIERADTFNILSKIKGLEPQVYFANAKF